ncbi:MAG: putative zinc-type alcohol dehydrogenase-like protein YdjJ [Arthrobacter sp.]|nr:putative zinc-type alcohol dehydrogenase-like protein YdjJ [Arthrobacter sp.]
MGTTARRLGPLERGPSPRHATSSSWEPGRRHSPKPRTPPNGRGWTLSPSAAGVELYAQLKSQGLHPKPLEMAHAVGADEILRGDDADAIAAVEADVVIEASGGQELC